MNIILNNDKYIITQHTEGDYPYSSYVVINFTDKVNKVVRKESFATEINPSDKLDVDCYLENLIVELNIPFYLTKLKTNRHNYFEYQIKFDGQLLYNGLVEKTYFKPSIEDIQITDIDKETLVWLALNRKAIGYEENGVIKLSKHYLPFAKYVSNLPENYETY